MAEKIIIGSDHGGFNLKNAINNMIIVKERNTMEIGNRIMELRKKNVR